MPFGHAAFLTPGRRGVKGAKIRPDRTGRGNVLPNDARSAGAGAFSLEKPGKGWQGKANGAIRAGAEQTSGFLRTGGRGRGLSG